MNKTPLSLALIFTLGFGFSSTALAAPPHHGPGLPLHMMPEHFTDTDGNGVINQEEVAAQVEAERDSRKQAAMAAGADSNGDGTLSREEMRAYHQQKLIAEGADSNGDGRISREERMAHRDSELLIDGADSNNDGQLSREERRAAMHARFDTFISQFDTNQDGVISDAETDGLYGYFEAQRQQHHGRDGRGGRGGMHKGRRSMMNTEGGEMMPTGGSRGRLNGQGPMMQGEGRQGRMNGQGPMMQGEGSQGRMNGRGPLMDGQGGRGMMNGQGPMMNGQGPLMNGQGSI